MRAFRVENLVDYSSDGTGTLGQPVITIPFRIYSCAAGNYSVCPFEALKLVPRRNVWNCYVSVRQSMLI